jgi:hypothetical protein
MDICAELFWWYDCFGFWWRGSFLWGRFFFGNFRSANNGLSWNAIGNDIPPNTGGFAIKVIGTNNVFIGNNKGIYFSNNKGNSFSNAGAGLDPQPNNTVQGIEANSKYLFAGLQTNGIWRRPLSDFGISMSLGEISAKINQQNLGENLKNKLDIYPNPAINEATIQYQTKATGEVQFDYKWSIGKSCYSIAWIFDCWVTLKRSMWNIFHPGFI